MILRTTSLLRVTAWLLRSHAAKLRTHKVVKTVRCRDRSGLPVFDFGNT
ncbi:MAG: hypothetical protein O2795_05850 [Acidobacteria bacterium]|nr:hypothetical protein [Acidobacteriota bacterium]